MLINHFCKRYQKKSSKKGRFFWPKLISWQIRPAPLHWAWAEPSRATRKSEGTRRGWPSGMTIWDERMNFMEFHEFQRHILGWKFHEFHELFMNFMNYGCIFWDEHEPKITKNWILAMNIDRIHWTDLGRKLQLDLLPQAQDLKST